MYVVFTAPLSFSLVKYIVKMEAIVMEAIVVDGKFAGKKCLVSDRLYFGGGKKSEIIAQVYDDGEFLNVRTLKDNFKLKRI